MARQYVKYYPQQFPNGIALRAREQKIVTTAQAGIADEKTLRQAIAAAQDNDIIVIAPVTITLTEALSITKPLRFVGSTHEGVSGPIITCSSAVTSAMIAINMSATAGASACEVTFENLRIAHAVDTYDTITVNNTNMAATFYLRIHDCSVKTVASSNSYALNVSQSTAGQAINVHISGDYANTIDAINFTCANASNRLVSQGVVHFNQGKTNAITTSAGAVAAQIKLLGVQVPEGAGVGGGNAAQLLISIGSWSLTGTTYAAADTNDFVGSQTETIIG